MRLRHNEDPKIERLRRIPHFEDSSKKALEHLAAAADEIEVPAGTVLIEAGHKYSEVYVITSGTAEVQIGDDLRVEARTGEVFGEIGLFCYCTASGTVRAKTDLEVLSIPVSAFKQTLLENPDLTMAIAQRLAIRLLEMDRRYVELAEAER